MKWAIFCGMKTFILLRHAKSRWDIPGLDDFERPLNARGERAAQDMGAYMARKKLDPDFVLCSAARRASETWHRLASFLQGPAKVSFRKSLYLATPGRLLTALQACPDEAESLLLIGHNPGLQRLALDLVAPGADDPNLAKLAKKLPTAAVAVMTFDVKSWQKIKPGYGTLERFVRPKDL